MRKGIIMEVNERFLTLLTPEGEFLKARKEKIHYEIGEEIQFFPFEEDRKKRFRQSVFNTYKGKSVAALAIAMVIAIVSFLPFYSQNQVYAYMSIDVNPSIELSLNEDLQVIELAGYNDSGEQIVEQLNDWNKKDVEYVTEKILMLIREKGYFDGKKNVVIGTVHTGEIIEESEKKLDQTLKELEENFEEEQTEFIAIEATEKERNLAKESGLTAGKLLIEMEKSSSEKEKKNSQLNEQPVKEQPKEDVKQDLTPDANTSIQKSVPNNVGVNQQKNQAEAKKQNEKANKQNGSNKNNQNQKEKSDEKNKKQNDDNKKNNNRNQNHGKEVKDKEEKKDLDDDNEDKKGNKDRSDDDKKDNKNRNQGDNGDNDKKKENREKDKGKNRDDHDDQENRDHDHD